MWHAERVRAPRRVPGLEHTAPAPAEPGEANLWGTSQQGLVGGHTEGAGRPLGAPGLEHATLTSEGPEQGGHWGPRLLTKGPPTQVRAQLGQNNTSRPLHHTHP